VGGYGLCAAGANDDNQAMVALKLRSAATGLLSLLVLVASLEAKDKKVFVTPAAHHAKTYPAHEEEPNEHLTVAADPYDMADKAEIFSVNYKAANFLPVLLILSNDSDQPISLSNMKVELITVNKEKLAAAAPDQIFRRIAKTNRPDQGVTLPVPFPRTKPKASVKAEAREEIEAAQFKALAVEPKMTRSGFLFFDIEGIAAPLAGARLFITGLKNAAGQDILYFEIPMEKYLSYQPPQL
jgi:hypothetical protein